MVPLGYFLIAWLVLLAIYAVLVLITLIQMLRHGIPSAFTYISTFVFIAVIVLVVVGCGLSFLNVNWNCSVNVIPEGMGFFFSGNDVPNDVPLDTPL